MMRSKTMIKMKRSSHSKYQLLCKSRLIALLQLPVKLPLTAHRRFQPLFLNLTILQSIRHQSTTKRKRPLRSTKRPKSTTSGVTRVANRTATTMVSHRPRVL